MTFLREHLSGSNYNWTLSNQVHKMKELTPTRNLFDRSNGNCILHMLNLFDELIVKLSVKDAQHLEFLLANELPSEAKSEMTVFNWLKETYIYSLSAKKSN